MALALGTLTAPAQAQVVYTNNFDAEAGGMTVLGYTAFNGLTVTRDSVDLVRNGDFDIFCAGGAGSCVDLSGTVFSPSGQLTSGSYAFGIGQTTTLAFLLSGNQRFLPGIDRADVALNFGSGLTGTWGYSIDGNVTDMGRFDSTQLTNIYTLMGSDPFRDMTVFFTPDSAGTVSFSIASGANNGTGAVLDNLSLSIASSTPVVPEPATWGMMLLGFGAIGAAVRRGRLGTAAIA